MMIDKTNIFCAWYKKHKGHIRARLRKFHNLTQISSNRGSSFCSPILMLLLAMKLTNKGKLNHLVNIRVADKALFFKVHACFLCGKD